MLNASTQAQLPFGTIDLGRKDYVSKTTTFGASGTAGTMQLSGSAITVTLGTPSATAGTAAATGTLVWTPSSTVTDPAGNAMSTTAVNETGLPTRTSQARIQATSYGPPHDLSRHAHRTSFSGSRARTRRASRRATSPR